MRSSPYFSFLLCSHQSGALVQAYVNGMPLGTIRNGTFEPHGLIYPNGEPISIQIHNLLEPFPFDSLDEMKKMLHQMIDKLEIVEPKKD